MESNHNQGFAIDIQATANSGVHINTILDWYTSTGVSLTTSSSTSTAGSYTIYTGTQGAKMFDDALKQYGVEYLQPEEEGYNYLKMIKVTSKNEKSKSNN
jgi:hypothetical protein